MIDLAAWHWPQITYAALTLMGLGLISAKHGQNREGKHNIWTTLTTTGLIVTLLVLGGFFA